MAKTHQSYLPSPPVHDVSDLPVGQRSSGLVVDDVRDQPGERGLLHVLHKSVDAEIWENAVTYVNVSSVCLSVFLFLSFFLSG
jgi:hypothetical protein